MVSIRRNKFTRDELKEKERVILSNLEVYKRNFFQILDAGLNKIVIVYCLPELLAHDGKLLKYALTQQELKTVVELYRITHASQRRNNVISDKSIRTIPSRSKFFKAKTKVQQPTQIRTPLNRTKTYYNDIIFTLHKNEEVLQIARSLIWEMPKDFLQIYAIWIGLRNHCAEIFNMTALDKKNLESNIRHAWMNNLYFRETIKELEAIYDEKFNDRINYKDLKLKIIFEEYLLKHEMNFKCNSEIMNIITKSEDEMRYENSKLDMNKVNCVVNLSDLYNKYEKRHALNLKDEKGLRKKIHRCQRKLNNIIQTFKDEISEVQNLYDEIEAQYEQEKVLYEDLKIKNEELIKTYERMVYEDHILLLVKVRMIRQQYAVRKIQRWWRNILKIRRRKFYKRILHQIQKSQRKPNPRRKKTEEYLSKFNL